MKKVYAKRIGYECTKVRNGKIRKREPEIRQKIKMADNTESENSGKKIKITVKTPKDKQEIELDADDLVKKVYKDVR